MSRPVFAILIALLVLCPPVHAISAQSADSLKTVEKAKKDVIAVLDKMFVAMRDGACRPASERLRPPCRGRPDSAAMRSVFHTDAKVVSLFTREGKTTVSFGTVDQVVAAIAALKGKKWDERMRNPEVRISGKIAQVWTAYDFYREDKFSHCGIDSYDLILVDGEWKVLWSGDGGSQKTGCPGQPQ
jgi:hypothetical protein